MSGKMCTLNLEMLSFVGGRFDEHFVLRELFSFHIIPKVSQTENKIYEMVKIIP